MNNMPISGLAELEAHLHQLLADASLPFNAKLLDDVELQLTGKSALCNIESWPKLCPQLLIP